MIYATIYILFDYITNATITITGSLNGKEFYTERHFAIVLFKLRVVWTLSARYEQLHNISHYLSKISFERIHFSAAVQSFRATIEYSQFALL